MVTRGFLDKLNLIKLLQTNEEKAKASRLVLREILTTILPKSIKHKKDMSLLEIIDCPDVKLFINDDQIISSLHFIRIVGISAEHGTKVRDKDTEVLVANLENFINFLISKQESDTSYRKPGTFTEAETRAAYIDLYLREAGWEVLSSKGIVSPSKAGIEIEVDNMPNNAGIGYCDYVLYDQACKPLAIVEAKKTSKDPQIGRHQADLYAESMEKIYGYKPIIYYTNGYEINVIDGVYPDRKVTAFHTLEELERMIQRRNRNDIQDMQPDENIAGRPYQKMALTNLCERFNNRHRRGLIVMATGTGKTRVSIALTDILARNGWIKNVLFLADRTALVKQAKANYTKLLPDMTVCELSEGNNAKKDLNARLMFSTYQTMINYIDAEDKEFSSGRFDLIIVDEAHRSIFNRYASIFAYFDSLLVGFTATPRDEVGSNTYSIFECESGEPTYDYGLSEAISERYLVGYQVENRHSRIMSEGIRRSDVSEDELDKYDDYFDGDDDPNLTIPANAIFKTIFNKATCRKVIEDLMANGLRVNNGETLGKTIIFAYNHKHAEMIVDEFRNLYPQYSANTCQLVDYSVNYAQSLVEKFDEDDEFRIAVSVDMLDTGIDVPAVLNLVFFKPVRSKIKFMQMIGRGTRLCKDLLGPNKDKKGFLIFDYCDNFDFFHVDHPELNLKNDQISLSQRLFTLRTEIVFSLQDYASQEDEFVKGYYDKTVNHLLAQVRGLKESSSRVSVRQNLKYVDKYTSPDSWIALTPVSTHEIKSFVAPLIEGGSDSDFSALTFDVLILKIQRSFLRNKMSQSSNDIKKIREIAAFLLRYKSAIPQVFEKAEVLKEAISESTWNEITFNKLEYLRVNIRELTKYIDSGERKLIDINVDDDIEKIDTEGRDDTLIDIRTYRERVIDYLTQNGEDPTIEKIRNLQQLDKQDAERLKQLLFFDLGSEEEYNENANGKSLGAFIRSLIGIDQEAVNKAFGKYLEEHQLNSKQQDFINTIVKYVQKNGDIELADMLNSDPFKSIDWGELFGGNVEPIRYTISILHDTISINEV